MLVRKFFQMCPEKKSTGKSASCSFLRRSHSNNVEVFFYVRFHNEIISFHPNRLKANLISALQLCAVRMDGKYNSLTTYFPSTDFHFWIDCLLKYWKRLFSVRQRCDFISRHDIPFVLYWWVSSSMLEW